MRGNSIRRRQCQNNRWQSNVRSQEFKSINLSWIAATNGKSVFYMVQNAEQFCRIRYICTYLKSNNLKCATTENLCHTGFPKRVKIHVILKHKCKGDGESGEAWMLFVKLEKVKLQECWKAKNNIYVKERGWSSYYQSIEKGGGDIASRIYMYIESGALQTHYHISQKDKQWLRLWLLGGDLQLPLLEIFTGDLFM